MQQQNTQTWHGRHYQCCAASLLPASSATAEWMYGAEDFFPYLNVEVPVLRGTEPTDMVDWIGGQCCIGVWVPFMH